MNEPMMRWAVFDGDGKISALYPSRRAAETLSEYYKEAFAKEGTEVELHVEGVNPPRRDDAVYDLGAYRELRDFISFISGGSRND